MLATMDAREQLVRKLGSYYIERYAGTDDVECAFSNTVQCSGGYMATVRRCGQAMRRAERRSLMKWDDTIPQVISRRKRYPPQMRVSRQEWNDGARLPVFWPRLPGEAVVYVGVAPKSETTHTSGAQATAVAVTSVRQHHIAQAVSHQPQ
jgi:hypothetical protein